ncbi:MAG TPA: hypothetical protein VEF06_09855 [Bryobacteraceae bacterium]|nr:hypothetical protein [Bryobacteraceae bacterium]
MRIVRSLASVAVGFGLFVGALQLIPMIGLQTGADATRVSYLFMTVAWTVVAAGICGFLTAWIAGAHEFPHVSGLGILMVGLSVLSMQQESLSRPSWYQTAIAGCGPISAMFGAAVRMLWRVRHEVKVKTSGDASRS